MTAPFRRVVASTFLRDENVTAVTLECYHVVALDGIVTVQRARCGQCRDAAGRDLRRQHFPRRRKRPHKRKRRAHRA